MTVKERLLIYLRHVNLGQKAFEQKARLSNGFVNSIGENVTTKSLNKIKDAFPELNINWLMSGKGEMLDEYIVFDAGSAIREIKETNTLILATCAEILARITNQSSTVLTTELQDLVNKRLNAS